MAGETMSSKSVVLRFRDLVSDVGGTISEHRSLIRSHDYTWWGWMMRPQEKVPRVLLCELRRVIDAKGNAEIFLFDTGIIQLYRCGLSRLAVAPNGTKIA